LSVMDPSGTDTAGARHRTCLLAPWPNLLGVVEREADDGRRNPLLEPVELSDLDLGSCLGIENVHAAERDVLLQDGRPRPTRDHAALRAPDVTALAVRRHLVPLQLEPDQPPLRMLAPLRQRLLADVVLLLRLRHGEADARFERIDLVVELRPGE